MFNAIIKALGGFTRHEYELLQVSLEGWRSRATAAETSVELFKEIMTREQARAQRLEDRLGIDTLPVSEQNPPNMNPVGDRKLSSWPRIKRELEKDHRVKSDAQVSREEIERKVREG